MRYFLILFSFMTLAICVEAQEVRYKYFDANHKKTKAKKAVYIEKITSLENERWSSVVTRKDGSLYQTGTYLDKHAELREGNFKFYFKNSELQAELNYKNNLLHGPAQVWYPDSTLDHKGNFFEGKREGEWLFYFKSGKLAAKEFYEEGERIEYDFRDEEGKSVALKFAEYEARYPGGDVAFSNFINKNLKFPKEALMRGVTGVVRVTFVVEKDGKVSEIYIKKSLNSWLDEEAIRVCKLLSDFEPAKEHNRFVKSAYTLPVSFYYARR